jgi:hypothetical protein
MDMQANELIDLIGLGLGKIGDRRVKDLSYDGDNDSSSLIVVTEDDKDGHQEWIISSSAIRLLEDDE